MIGNNWRVPNKFGYSAVDSADSQCESMQEMASLLCLGYLRRQWHLVSGVLLSGHSRDVGEVRNAITGAVGAFHWQSNPDSRCCVHKACCQEALSVDFDAASAGLRSSGSASQQLTGSCET